MAKPEDIFSLFGVVVVMGAIGMYMNQEPKPQTKAPADPASQELFAARYICQGLIKPRLRDPDSADWGAMSENYFAEWPAAKMPSGSIKVFPAFRGQNAFGATVQSRWICELSKVGGEWKQLRLEEA